MHVERSDPKTRARAISLRHAATPEERMLWARLRNDQLGVNFRRQHAIGPYITDFCCIECKVVIELDGGQHLEQVEYDAGRTAYLESRGYRVLRFWNLDVRRRLADVLAGIAAALDP